MLTTANTIAKPIPSMQLVPLNIKGDGIFDEGFSF